MMNNLQNAIGVLRGTHGLDRVIGAIASDVSYLITHASRVDVNDHDSIEKLSKIQRLLYHAKHVAESLKL